MNVRFFKLYLVLVSISDWGRNGDSDGRRTGGGAGGKGVHGWDGGGGGGSEDGGDKSDGIFGRNDVDGWAGGVYARNMSKRSRWDRDGGGLRSRRSAAKGHYVVAHQSEQGMSNPSKHKLKTNDTCKPKTDANLIIVHEYMLTSAKLEGTVPAGGCEILLNGPTEGMWKNQEGFDVNGEMEGVSISDRKFGNEAKEKQKQKKKEAKVDFDLRVDLEAGAVNLTFSERFKCDDEGAFMCRGGETLCISQGSKCDSIHNCINGSDEESWRCNALGNPKLLTFLVFIAIAIIVIVPFCIVRRVRRKRQPHVPVQHVVSTSSSQSR